MYTLLKKIKGGLSSDPKKNTSDLIGGKKIMLDMDTDIDWLVC